MRVTLASVVSKKIVQLRVAARALYFETANCSRKVGGSFHEMLIVRLSPLILIMHTTRLAVCDRCCQINYRELPRYELMKSNSRSKQPIISRRVVSNVSECERFAASKKALAFNFVSARDRAGMRK